MYYRLKGYKIFKDRHGKMRCYHRASGEPVDLDKFPLGSDAFLAEATRIINLHQIMPPPKAGTWGMLVKQYKTSKEFTGLADKTRRGYEDIFTMLTPLQESPLHKFDAPAVVKIRDKIHEKHGWWTANYTKTVISAVFSWGGERGLMTDNPAKRVKKIRRPKGLERANRPWTLQECAVVLAEAGPHELPIYAALFFTGIDTCDAIVIPKIKYDGVFSLNRQKTGNAVWKPSTTTLKAIIADMPSHNAITLFANSRGKPWTKSGFDTVWQKRKKNLEERGLIGKGLTLKGLRHTHATLIRQQGESDRTVADALGDKTEAMGRWYSRDADVSEKMERVMKTFEEKYGKIVKPTKKAVKP